MGDWHETNFKITIIGLVAQWSEQSAHNRLVGGSNPSGATF